MDHVTDAATVTGGPEPDPLLLRTPSGGPRSTGSSRSAALRGAGPLSATGQTPGALSIDDHVKQPLKKGFPSPCLPQEQLRSLPLSAALFLRCLLESPAEGGCLPGSEGAASWALACPLVGLWLESSQRRVLILGEFWEWRQKFERREQTVCVKVTPPPSLEVTRGDWGKREPEAGVCGPLSRSVG